MMQFDAMRVIEILLGDESECGRSFVFARTHIKKLNHYEITDRSRRVFLDGYNIFHVKL